MNEILTHPTKEQAALIGAWRLTAQAKMPYMAHMLFSFTPVIVNGGKVDTFAIDPQLRLYINMDNVAKRSIDFGAEGLLHEAGHIFGEHDEMAKTFGIPMTSQARELWNYAGDCAINDDLRDAGCSELANHGVFAAHIGMPDYLTPMQYYQRLADLVQAGTPEPGPGEPDEGGDGRDGSGTADAGQGGPSGPGKAGSPGDTETGPSQSSGEGDQKPYSGCGSGTGSASGDFEIVPGSPEDKEFPGMDGDEVQEVIVHTAMEIIETRKAQGYVPAGLAVQAELALAPTPTPWNRLFASAVKRAAGSQRGDADLDQRRRDRRQFGTTLRSSRGGSAGQVITFGRMNKEPTLVLMRDTSGSMSHHDVSTVSSEFFSIARRLSPARGSVMVHDVDAKVYKGEELTRGNCSAVLNKVTGRGGTDMTKCFRYVQKHYVAIGKKPSALVIATDGGTGWPKEAPSYPVIVVLTKSGNYTRRDIPSWATVVELQA